MWLSSSFRLLKRRPNPIVHVELRAPKISETFVGIVVGAHPFRLLVPAHAIGLLEDDPASIDLLIDGEPCGFVCIEGSPFLARDQLAVLRLRSCDTPRRGITRLTERPCSARVGEPLQILTKKAPHEPPVVLSGNAVEFHRTAEGETVFTDIPIEAGLSGSPILQSSRLCAVCQGIAAHSTPKRAAIGIPLSRGSRAELLNLRLGPWRRLRPVVLSGLIIAAALAAWGGMIALRSLPISSAEIADDAKSLTIHTNAPFPARDTRTYHTESAIWTYELFASKQGGPIDRLAVGTAAESGTRGKLLVLDARARVLWEYAVPDGDCIYTNAEEIGRAHV